MPTLTPSKFLSSFASSSRDKYPQISIEFPDGFASGALYKWCQGLSGESRSIASLQIRRDVGGAVPHRFVMVHMWDRSIHRFDRRPEQKTSENIPGHTLFDLVRNKAVKREDSYIANLSPKQLDDISTLTYCEIELFFEEQQLDLLTIVSACFGISRNSVADKYTFLKHNCFFFSWTILMVVLRHCLPYAIPLEKPLRKLFEPKEHQLVKFVVDRGINVFLDLVIQVILIVREKLNDFVILTKRRMPDRVLRFLWRRIATLRLKVGLRRRLTEQTQKIFDAKITPLYQLIMDMGAEPEWLDKHL